MIIRTNKIETIAVGRYEQTLKSEFVLRSMPSWLTPSTNVNYIDNGIEINGTILSFPMVIDKVEQVNITISNLHWQTLPTSPSITLTDGQSYIGLKGDAFIYNDGNANIINENVGMVNGSQVWSWFKTLGATNFFSGAKNITIVIQPFYGYYHVLHNGEPVHSGHYSPLALTGDWHWEIKTGEKAMHLNGVEISIQQNI